MDVVGFTLKEISRVPGDNVIAIVDVDFLINNSRITVSGMAIQPKVTDDIIETCIANAKDNCAKFVNTNTADCLEIVKLTLSERIKEGKDKLIQWCEEENEDISKFINELPSPKEQAEISSLLNALGIVAKINILDGSWSRLEVIAFKDMLVANSKRLESE